MAFHPQPSEVELSAHQVSKLSTALFDVLYKVFGAYLGDELDDYLWYMEKLWPSWIAPISRSDIEWSDTQRLYSLTRQAFADELEEISALRPLRTKQDDHTNLSVAIPSVSRTPSKTASTSTDVFSSPSLFYTSPARTPSKSDAQLGTTKSALASLPILSQYILIAAFLASANPAKKDILMVATEEDELLASKRKRKKGGGTRKTPNRSQIIGKDGQIKRNALPQRMLGPKAFPIERLVAICDCILPVHLRKLTKGPIILQEVSVLHLW